MVGLTTVLDIDSPLPSLLPPPTPPAGVVAPLPLLCHSCTVLVQLANCGTVTGPQPEQVSLTLLLLLETDMERIHFCTVFAKILTAAD